MPLYNGPCLDVMEQLDSHSIDLILCDLPYGTTKCKWDIVIPFEPLWAAYKRLIKPGGAILLFGVEPFTSRLIVSNLQMFRYTFVWNKRKAANFLFGNKQPLKITEDIAVFYKHQPTYNPQKTINPRGPEHSGRKGIGNTIHEHLPNCPKSSQPGKSYEADKLLPTNILEYSKPTKPIHPTQKPVELLKYLINTYTDKGAVVLDNCMGSGSTGVACVETGRNFIGIDSDLDYCRIARKRIKDAQSRL
jgi:DNA modification methylase